MFRHTFYSQQQWFGRLIRQIMITSLSIIIAPHSELFCMLSKCIIMIMEIYFLLWKPLPLATGLIENILDWLYRWSVNRCSVLQGCWVWQLTGFWLVISRLNTPVLWSICHKTMRDLETLSRICGQRVMVNNRQWTSVAFMLGERLRRWANIKTTLGQRLVLPGTVNVLF